jgi:hypothetical protein
MEEFELEPGEQIQISVRKHWLVFVGELLPFAILALLPFLVPVAVAYLGSVNPQFTELIGDNLSTANPWVRLFLGLWWLLMWTGAFNTFTRYFLDQWIVTTTRIVDIHQFGFFRRHVSSFLLNHVQDVTTDVNGFFETLVGFGTLRVETAGDESRHFIMSGIPDPQGLRDLIMRDIAALHADKGVPSL